VEQREGQKKRAGESGRLRVKSEKRTEQKAPMDRISCI